MHLHRLVRGGINAVNRDKLIVWLQSQGPIIDATGIATPTYATPQNVWAQIQPLSTDQLAHMENLNIQGVLRQVYLKNAIASAVRSDGTGGDLLLFPERWATPLPPTRVWLVMAVTEQWDSWCLAIVRMQNDINNIWTTDSDVVTTDSSRTIDA